MRFSILGPFGNPSFALAYAFHTCEASGSDASVTGEVRAGSGLPAPARLGGRGIAPGLVGDRIAKKLSLRMLDKTFVREEDASAVESTDGRVSRLGAGIGAGACLTSGEDFGSCCCNAC